MCSSVVCNVSVDGLEKTVKRMISGGGPSHDSASSWRTRARRRARAAFLAACSLLALLLSSEGLLAAVEDTAADSAATIQPPSAPKPAPGRLRDLPRAFRKDTPTTLADLKGFEQHVEKIVARVSPAVVAVEVGGGSGSGVVISADGVVLCAAHVCGEPDRDVTFTFPDGKKAKGKTLGTNHEMDAGLMRITDKGEWPHVEVGELNRAGLGDWVLALGHPGGFDARRSTVVRLGRIIRLVSFALQSDCTLIGGDSGGPLFDMYGRVVAIHSRISDSTAENFHVPIGIFQETWERLANGEDWGGPRSPTWAGAWGLDAPEGFRVELVHRNGPGEKAGLKVGDIVMKVNGKAVKDYKFFKDYVSRTRQGREITLDIRRDGEEMSVKLTIESDQRDGGGRFGQ
jgi:serine protease Do